MILTPPLSAELTILAYAFKLLGTLRSRVTGAIGRAANSSSLSFTLILRFGISISIISPSTIFPILPPAAASGEICPMLNPEVPPLKRPSVIRAHSFPYSLDLILEVGYSISCIPGPPFGPS